MRLVELYIHVARCESVVRYTTSCLICIVVLDWLKLDSRCSRLIELIRIEEVQVSIIKQRERYV